MTHPLVPTKMKAEMLMLRAAAEFGLTPSARARLTGLLDGRPPGEPPPRADLTLGGLLDYS
jgi:phage terminase small subunit